jgi:hypothetical protein
MFFSYQLLQAEGSIVPEKPKAGDCRMPVGQAEE